QSIEISPGFAAAYTNLCGARIAAGENLRAAISDCNESLALEPKQVFAFNHRGFANLKLGSVSKAIADFDAALSNDAKFAWSLYGRGLAKWKKGDEKGAEADVAAASKIRPDIAKSVGKYYGVAAEADFATRIFAAYARVNPMIFVMAKGDADACGPGCDEWIAAEGVFDIGVEKRFRNFLSTLKGRNLPIFFNSSGGFLQQSYGIGRILRSRKMTAIIGATFPEGCAGNLLDDICRRKIQSGTALKAHLRIAGARCYSGCVYALMGASVRQVPAGTFLGVHAPPRVDEKGHAERRRYARQMDIDPELVDLADKIPYFDMYSLSRDEIARFRIEAPQR
ncbi:MAG: hypothetical protein ACXWJ5_04435, partial [Xanthobacteraceae bacterium]